MARFSLPCHPWQSISVYRVHNSTVSKQLRYSLAQESVHHPVSSDEAPYVVVECRLRGTRGNQSVCGNGYLEKKKILGENYGLKMSVELEGRMNEMCNVSDYWEEVALQTGRKEGRKKQAMETALKLKKKGHSLEDIAECVDFDVETVRKWLVS